MNESQKLLYEHYREAEQRLDYFILGGTGATCAYIGQTITPQFLGVSPYGLEILSLLSLLLSLIFGFLRIEQITFSKSLNYNWEIARERSPENCKDIVDRMTKVSDLASISYRLRNDLLIAGFYGLILSKILSPYFH